LDQTQSAALLADILRAALWRVVLHSDYFPGQSGLKDHMWIPMVTSAIDDCAIISSDKSMRLWTSEDGKVREAIEASNAKVFFLSSTSKADKRTLQDQAMGVLKAQKDICRWYRRHGETHFVGRIHLGGRLGEVQKLFSGTRRARGGAKEDVA
jgi:hypothetical protein